MADPTALAQLERLAVEASKAAARALEGAVEMRIDAHTADVEEVFLRLNQLRQGIVRLLDVPPVVHAVAPVHASASASLSAIEADWDLSESTAAPPPSQSFQCPLCDKSYAKRHVLDKHVTLRHQQLPIAIAVNPSKWHVEHPSFPCAQCGDLFMRAVDMRSHMVRVHALVRDTHEWDDGKMDWALRQRYSAYFAPYDKKHVSVLTAKLCAAADVHISTFKSWYYASTERRILNDRAAFARLAQWIDANVAPRAPLQPKQESERRREVRNDALRRRACAFFVAHEKEKDALEVALVVAARITLPQLRRWLCYPNPSAVYQERGTRCLTTTGALGRIAAWLDAKEAT